MDSIGLHTVRDLLERRAEEMPDKLGWVFEGEAGELTQYSCAEFDAAINQVARGLQLAGITKGEKVAIRLANRPENILTWCACAKIGAVAVPTITSLSVEETQFVVGRCEASMVVTEPHHLEVVEQAVRSCPAVKRIVVTGTPNALPANGVSFDVLSDTDGAYERPALDLRDELQMLFTSGTTSKPKGVVLTHGNTLHAAERVARAMQLGPADRNLSGLPFFHANCQVNCFASSLLAGATVILLERFSVSRYWQQVRRHDATVTTVILPAVLLEQPPTPQDVNHRVRLAFAGSLPPNVEEEFERRFGVPLLLGYGLTEAMVDVTMSPTYGPRRSPSVGLPSIGRTVRIVDETGAEVPIGEPGEIVVEGESGVTLMKGYYRDPEATAHTLRGGVLHTEDVGRFDEHGYLHFVGRLKDMIKRGGENVAAAEVEEVLSRHEAVLEAAVLGVPDDVLGEAVLAFVIPAEGAGVLTEEDLAAHCARHLAPFKVPARFELRDELPRTSIGKIAKALLREELLTAQPAEASA
jgi:crotonobetaine/carnitine-CoA ligase